LALLHSDGPRGMVGCPSISLAQALPMPHKHNAARRHHIPKMSFKGFWCKLSASLTRAKIQRDMQRNHAIESMD
jgi:hypothetical protein